MSLNQSIYDQIIAHSIGIERLKAGLTRQLDKQLSELDQSVLGLFVLMIGSNRSEQIKYAKKIRELKQGVYSGSESELSEQMQRFAEKQSVWLSALFGASLGSALVSNPPTITLTQINRTEYRGKTIKATLSDLMDEEIDRLVVLAKTAVSDGLTVKEAKESFKLLKNKRTNKIRAIVHTITAGTNTAANDAVFKSNDRFIKGIRLAVVFDNRTTPTCIQHSIDNKLYPIDDYPKPPFHWGCRTIAVQEVKSYEDLGLSMRRKVPVNTRASMTGDTTVDTTYNQWLRRQTKEIQNDALGRTRADLFRAGKLPLTKFIDPTGKFYTVDELFLKYDI